MILQLILFVFIYFIVIFITALFQWPIWILYLYVIIGISFIIGNMFYTIYGTTNMKRVEKYLLKNKWKPSVYFVYIQAHGSKDDIIQAIDKMLKRYKNSFIQQYYSSVREYYCENYESALNLAEHIERQPFKDYMKALIYTKLEKLEEAEKLLPLITKVPLNEQILALISYKKNDLDHFELHKKKSIEASKGIQRYNLIHIYERFEKEGF